jgi:hypothetical protein
MKVAIGTGLKGHQNKMRFTRTADGDDARTAEAFFDVAHVIRQVTGSSAADDEEGGPADFLEWYIIDIG